jgi:hypothetical protein
MYFDLTIKYDLKFALALSGLISGKVNLNVCNINEVSFNRATH